MINLYIYLNYLINKLNKFEVEYKNNLLFFSHFPSNLLKLMITYVTILLYLIKAISSKTFTLTKKYLTFLS